MREKNQAQEQTKQQEAQPYDNSRGEFKGNAFLDKLRKEHGSTSAAFRFLMKQDSERTYHKIAKMTNKRPQHVRNVMITPLKKDEK